MKMGSRMIWNGRVRYEVWERNRCIRKSPWYRNGLTQVAVNYILNVAIRGDAQTVFGFLGLIQSDNFATFAAADTMSSHAGWEEATAYDESTRPAWSPPAATAGILANADPLLYTVNALKTFIGVFLTSDATKGGSTGILFSTALFDADLSLLVGQVIKVFYEIELLGIG